MQPVQQTLYAVVTGDVVDSSKLSVERRDRLYSAMRATSTAVRTAFGPAIPIEVDIFRGDSWQMLITRPASALRIALFYRATLRYLMAIHRFDVRLALGIGGVSLMPTLRVSEGDGDAFRASGRALESLSRSSTMSLAFPGQPEENSLDVVVRLIDALAARWSDRQALAVTGALQGWTQKKIARTCWRKPITQQAVAQHLDRAAWTSVETGLEFFEETVREIVGRQQVK